MRPLGSLLTMRWAVRGAMALAAAVTIVATVPSPAPASEGEKPKARTYVMAPKAPRTQTWEAVNGEPGADAKNDGCVSCHTETDRKTMHTTDAVVLACVDCHGGDSSQRIDPAAHLKPTDRAYIAVRDKAHVLPKYEHGWGWPSSANPKRSYTLLNKEAPEYIRFVNPSDYRVARLACGECHIDIIRAAERSLMATGAMLWGGGAYNNGIVPYKNYMFGEAYTAHGEPAQILSPAREPNKPGTVTPEEAARGALPVMFPLPTWHILPPGDIFRVFERGGRNINTNFAEVGLPNSLGNIQRLEEPGRPDLKQSNRGPGTGLRTAIPVLNIHKTRLNDPFMWFMGTNDQPGDYRNSGCAGCHVVYANSREVVQSLTYAKYGRDGQTDTRDPTIRYKQEPKAGHGGHDDGHGKAAGHHGPPAPDHDRQDPTDHASADMPPHPVGSIDRDKLEKGHPIRHSFTKAIPTAQCMNCHMHQPNIFLNSYLGYTMWDYESDAPLMWPKEQKYPTIKERFEVLDRNPEAASAIGKWSDVDFLRRVYDDVNPQAEHTQFADYHGHGWNFRAIYKRDREGYLLDAAGQRIVNDPNDPAAADKFRQRFQRDDRDKFGEIGKQRGNAVHMMDIHAEKGLQCADCHFGQDSHGNGLIYGEVANAVEIGCKDCHGTADELPNLRTSGPAAPPKGNDLSLLRNQDGKPRFEWTTGKDGEKVLIQRSIVDPDLKWEVSLVKQSVDRASSHFNPLSARSKLMSKVGKETSNFAWGPGVAKEDRAHDTDKMACFTCHLSWTTSCGGCHLPIEANWKTSSHKYDGIQTRNFATYNPQVARDEMYQLGIHQTTKGNIIAPIRSTSALVLSSTNVNRERIYIQQPPISAAGFSSQAFAPHFPHTVRKTETKKCTDCHISDEEDNNAIMAQLNLLGTNFVNFVGMNAWTGLEKGIEAVRVTEWDEPQAVIGSYLQEFAYPDYWKAHQKHNRELIEWVRGKRFGPKLSGEPYAVEEFANTTHPTGGEARCVQLRGEYLFVAQGKAGFEIYDVASIANKGTSQRILTAPFSPLGHNATIKTKNATCMAIPTGQAISTERNDHIRAAYPQNEEQKMGEIYRYAFVTDSVEGLIVVNVETFADGEPRNNFIKRTTTFNPNNELAGARHITIGGNYAYIAASSGLVVVDIKDPKNPVIVAKVALNDMRASAMQFRYLWVTTAEGLRVLDVTNLARPVLKDATVPLANAQRIYLARTYAYVAAKQEGLAIVDITRPLKPSVYQMVTFEGKMNDAEDVIIGTTNASLFGYVADGRNGLKVIQLTSPRSQPNFYGFSPAPKPELIAWAKTASPALSLSKGLDRDRGVDESGNQIAIFGRIGSRPFCRAEMEKLFLNSKGEVWKVSDKATFADWVDMPKNGKPVRANLPPYPAHSQDDCPKPALTRAPVVAAQ